MKISLIDFLHVQEKMLFSRKFKNLVSSYSVLKVIHKNLNSIFLWATLYFHEKICFACLCFKKINSEIPSNVPEKYTPHFNFETEWRPRKTSIKVLDLLEIIW